MSKYPINKEFFPFSLFAPPIQNARVAGWLGSKMRPPRRIWRDRQVPVRRELISGYEGYPIELLVFEPAGIPEPSPCLVYYHGGGFFFGAAGYHYRLAMQYAVRTPCKLVFVQYRLAPGNQHPIPAEDSFAALCWTAEHSADLGIDPARIAVGGDSAGGALAAAVCQMTRDRGGPHPRLQMLIYPVTDRRMQTESNRLYTDTPMWNSRLSAKMWQGYAPDVSPQNIAYASPMEAQSFEALPQAYVEVAEFDCLRDEGIAYAEALRAGGAEVTLCERCGTMHGFDIVERAPTAIAAVDERIEFLKNKFFINKGEAL